MQMGTGKTRVAIELIHSTDSDLALFICPFSTKENLQTEINKWKLKTNHIVVAYESISSSDRIYSELLTQIKNKKLFIVADESIFIKNEESKRFNRLVELAKLSEYRLILNGTPITNNEWDLYNQMYFLSPKIIGMNRQQFLNTFFTRIRYKKKFEKPKEFYKLSKVNVDYLYKLIEPYIFKVELNFDKKIQERYYTIPASAETIQKYNDIKEQLLDSIRDEEIILDKLMLMKYVMFTDGERLTQIAEHINDQCIVYARYIKEAEFLAKHTNGYLITGSTPQNERVNIISKFKNDNKPLIMTYGVGSYGLNLQFCSHIIFSSITFDYGKVEQAQARIKRIGQERDIKYTYLRSNLGLYRMIENNLINKENLHDLIFKRLKEGDTAWLESI